MLSFWCILHSCHKQGDGELELNCTLSGCWLVCPWCQRQSETIDAHISTWMTWTVSLTDVINATLVNTRKNTPQQLWTQRLEEQIEAENPYQTDYTPQLLWLHSWGNTRNCISLVTQVTVRLEIITQGPRRFKGHCSANAPIQCSV